MDFQAAQQKVFKGNEDIRRKGKSTARVTVKGQSWASAGGGRYEVKTGMSYLFEGLRYSPTVCPASWGSKARDTFFRLRAQFAWKRAGGSVAERGGKTLLWHLAEAKRRELDVPTIFREDVYFPHRPTWSHIFHSDLFIAAVTLTSPPLLPLFCLLYLLVLGGFPVFSPAGRPLPVCPDFTTMVEQLFYHKMIRFSPACAQVCDLFVCVFSKNSSWMTCFLAPKHPI